MLSIPRGYTLLPKASKVGHFPRIYGRCRFRNRGKCEIGNNISIRSTYVPVLISVQENAELKIGDNVYINEGVDIGCTKHITIGNNVLIGGFSVIIDNDFHPVDCDTTNIGRDVVISDNVWIARNCIILPGVTIGKNSVVGAGSVVTKNVPDNTLVTGNPAIVKKKLNIPDGWVRRNANL